MDGTESIIQIGGKGEKTSGSANAVALSRCQALRQNAGAFVARSQERQMSTFLMDEVILSQYLEAEVPYPIRLFDLNCCGIDSHQFISDILPSFSQLEWDLYTIKNEQFDFLLRFFPEKCEQITGFFNEYYANHIPLEVLQRLAIDLDAGIYQYLQSIRPHRKRAIASFDLFQEKPTREWIIAKRPLDTFTQKTDDYRMRPRTFPNMSNSIIDHVAFKNLLIYLARLVQSIRPEIQCLQFICHQVSIVTSFNQPADNAPEGIHQDGADYIVSALVIERRNVQGGTSIIYGPDKQTIYLTVTLQPGQGIFQADQGSDLWHDVTPIVLELNSSGGEGVRNILGFDILIDR